MRVAFLGPPGTFSEQALRASASGPVELVPCTTFRDAARAVQDGDADRAVVPVENALEGSIDETLDALVEADGAVIIVGEVVQPVRHCLAGPPGLVLEAIRAVVSHPQALAQCRRFLHDTLPGAEQVAATSTAEAVRAVAAEPGGVRAALGPRLAAERYGAEVVRDGVEDEPGNATRFVWLAPGGTAAGPAGSGGAGGAWRTSLAFAGHGADAPGWLARCLSEFAVRGVNLTRIESRPSREGLGRYRFFVDLDGAADAPEVAGAVAGLRAHCEEVRTLGTYPAA